MQIAYLRLGTGLKVSGRVGGANVADLRQELLSGVEKTTGDFTLDVQGLIVTDRCVLGTVLEAHRRAERQERKLLLVNVSAELGRMLRRTRLDRILHVQQVLELEPLALAGIE